jgi:SAM-dependent methyltransferase
MTEGNFEVFLQSHPRYCSAYDRLFAASRLLGTSAQLVYELHSETLGSVADSILSFVESAYPSNYLDIYISRVQRMAELQAKFDANPSPTTLGDSTAVSTEAYSLALLLSIVFTSHRFEIMQALDKFLRTLPAEPSGHLASVGCGTGYELKLAAELLPTWSIAGYDTEAEMHGKAEQLLRFFHISKAVEFRNVFPLTEGSPIERQYDAIILCELLEHLPDPAQALRTVRKQLKDNGKLFLTAAINIAQEDHVFLYPDIETCRRQLSACGLAVEEEWIAPQTIRIPPANREIGFRKGNYIAIVAKASGVRDFSS